jgi:hypothetical protein
MRAPVPAPAAPVVPTGPGAQPVPTADDFARAIHNNLQDLMANGKEISKFGAVMVLTALGKGAVPSPSFINGLNIVARGQSYQRESQNAEEELKKINDPAALADLNQRVSAEVMEAKTYDSMIPTSTVASILTVGASPSLDCWSLSRLCNTPAMEDGKFTINKDGTIDLVEEEHHFYIRPDPNERVLRVGEALSSVRDHGPPALANLILDRVTSGGEIRPAVTLGNDDFQFVKTGTSTVADTANRGGDNQTFLEISYDRFTKIRYDSEGHRTEEIEQKQGPIVPIGKNAGLIYFMSPTEAAVLGGDNHIVYVKFKNRETEVKEFDRTGKRASRD